MTNGDSTQVDTAIVYEIPTIIDFLCPSDQAFGGQHIPDTVVPHTYDHCLVHTLGATPFTAIDLGYGQPGVLFKRGQYPPNTRVYMNGHVLEETVFGYHNFTILPVQFLDRITIERTYLTDGGVNLHTKINRYDRPFSMISYSTGSHQTSQYQVDLTRPITNDHGIFLSGLYGESAGFSQNNHSELGAAYLNMYSNVPVPARLDVMFSVNEYGIPGTDNDTSVAFVESRFFDACLLFGSSDHKAAIYHTRYDHAYDDSIQGISAETHEKSVAAEIKNYMDLGGVDVQYGVTGTYGDIESNCYGAHTVRSLTATAGATRALGRFRFSVVNKVLLRNDYPLQYTPTFGFDASLFDSTYLSASISRQHRIPSIAETTIPTIPLPQAYYMIGVDTLKTEHFWSQEIGIISQYLTILAYKQDYQQQIIIENDGNDNLMPTNRVSSRTTGVEFSIRQRVFLRGSAADKNSTFLHLIASGNYLFDENPLALLPREYVQASIGLQRETPRFGCGFTVLGHYIGERTDLSSRTIDIVRSVDLIGSIRFVSLSFTLRADNIFDEPNTVLPDYPVHPRSYIFSIRWDFWD
jgi:outer membrane receptor protein involved in Fe transport